MLQNFVLVYCRTFLGLTAESKSGLLETYVKAVDKCLADYKLPLYYEVFSSRYLDITLNWCNMCIVSL